MDYSNFPPPYDREVARRMDQAVEELSPEGLNGLERIKAAFATTEPAESPEAIVADMVPLPRADRAVLVSLNWLLAKAFHAAAEENQGLLDLLAQEGRILRRAAELDPTFAAEGTSRTGA